MWLITTRGFYSVVTDPEDQSMLVIRARVRGDLENLNTVMQRVAQRKLKIRAGGGTDYAYRASISRTDWAGLAAVLAGEISYTNFKSEVERVQGKRRHDVYMRVWGILHTLQHQHRRRQGTLLRDWRPGDG